jgi:hypothetical protein
MEKIYCGNWKVRTSQYWDFYTLSLKYSDLEAYVNERGYVSIVVNKRKEADKFWNDLRVTINDYKPQETGIAPMKWDSKLWKEEISIEDIPF